jgi:hypothetical protein
MQIEFSTPSWSFDRESVIVSATADSRPVRCIVPMEWLTAPYAQRLDESSALALFDERSDEIETALRERITAGAFTSPGEVILRP